MKTVIWWIRRDLRLADNQALAEALRQANTVIPVFILDPKLWSSEFVGPARLGFLLDGLRALDASLRERGSRLILRKGDPLEVLRALCQESLAEGIFAEEDYSPYARQRDEKIALSLPLNLVPGVTIFPPQILTKANGEPYTVFTPFSRLWRSLPVSSSPLPAPEHLLIVPELLSLDIPAQPNHPTDSFFRAGEPEAQRRLTYFTDSNIIQYASTRNRMDLDGTSQLSPYLRLGMLSARQAVWAARKVLDAAVKPEDRDSVETWLNELIWREFYSTILYYFPFVRGKAFKANLRQILWRNNPAVFSAWKAGLTGYPVVDAAMRQLNATGWMHNRARMITASFLTKDLLIDWREGERFFMQQLLDGDPASNNGGWQWTAGTGTDAAPYFRVFNPILQGKKFDPEGDYVRKWVPELKNVPINYLHAPWEMPLEVQKQMGCVIGHDYPDPIVDHAMARKRVLLVYRGQSQD
ncbi:MAG TPA: deoxyribodipyrimidine photo-lyase [Anaerolineaceae bacterium]|jgi:deoxyribodipyrimidine photo-lyase|nr:deoxyribodipyrimidine photo-lyase [Anaerolineaceae bacterium]